MNCEEVMAVLDNERLDGIPAGRRQLITAHVAVCDACARAWNLQSALAALPDVDMPAGLAAQCRLLVAAGRGSAPVARFARPLRLIGAAAVVAAAAVLLFLLRPDPVVPGQVQEGTQAGIQSPEIAGAHPQPGARAIEASILEAALAQKFTVRLLPAKMPDPTEQTNGIPAISPEVARANSVNPLRGQSLQALESALTRELLKVPDLSLVESDPEEGSATRKHFRLTIGLVSMLGRDGKPMPVDPRYLQVTLTVEEVTPGGKSVPRMGPSALVDLEANCFSDVPSDPPCLDVPSVATAMVKALTQGFFPPSPAMTAPLLAQFRDASGDITLRLEALEELYKLQERMGDTSLLRDPAVVQAAIALAATGDAALRARLWRTLKGAGNVELVQPLLASLVEESEDVRLAALETLSADFISDPRVRTALEATLVGDQRPLVRAVAMRGLSGETAWRQYVTSSLKDRDLPAEQRVEALVYLLYPPGPTRTSSSSPSDYFQKMEELLDDDAVRALAEAIPESNGLGRGANNLLGNFGSRFRDHPAIPEMMLRVLQGDPKPLMRAVAADHLGRLHLGEPRVRQALVRARDSDPEARVRESARFWLDKLP